MYAHTSFRGAKTCKIGQKGWCFWSYDKFWKGQADKLKKNACENAYLGSVFIPEKYVFRVCFESPFTQMISNLKYKWGPLGKKGPTRNEWFRHRSQICVSFGLVIGWWSKLRATHPYPTQSWVPPPCTPHYYPICLAALPGCTLQTPKCMAVFCSDVTSHK